MFLKDIIALNVMVVTLDKIRRCVQNSSEVLLAWNGR